MRGMFSLRHGAKEKAAPALESNRRGLTEPRSLLAEANGIHPLTRRVRMDLAGLEQALVEADSLSGQRSASSALTCWSL